MCALPFFPNWTWITLLIKLTRPQFIHFLLVMCYNTESFYLSGKQVDSCQIIAGFPFSLIVSEKDRERDWEKGKILLWLFFKWFRFFKDFFVTGGVKVCVVFSETLSLNIFFQYLQFYTQSKYSTKTYEFYMRFVWGNKHHSPQRRGARGCSRYFVRLFRIIEWQMCVTKKLPHNRKRNYNVELTKHAGI